MKPIAGKISAILAVVALFSVLAAIPAAAHHAEFTGINATAHASSASGSIHASGEMRMAGTPKSVMDFREAVKSNSFATPAIIARAIPSSAAIAPSISEARRTRSTAPPLGRFPQTRDEQRRETFRAPFEFRDVD